MTIALASRTKLAARLAAAIPVGVLRFRADDRAAWLGMRRQDVTASVVAALVGEHPYQTAFGLYATKTGQVPDPEVEPVITDSSISLPPMLRGTVLEPIAPQLLLMLRPTWSVEACGWYYRETLSRIGATPDFIAIDPSRKGFGVVQVKTTDSLTFRKVWRADDGTVEPPLFIVLQAIVEAVLTGASWAAVAVIVSGSNLDLHLIAIPLHLGAMDRLRSEVAGFWRGIAAGQPPKADYGRDSEVLAAMYREDNGQEIDLTGINHLPALLDDRDWLKTEIKGKTNEVNQIDAELKFRLGPNEGALIAGGRRVTWRREQRGHRFVPPSETRVLRVSSAR